jgi:hypothetical protein
MLRPPTYPVILTKSNWDLNKGSMGKAPGELGIGPAITAAQTDFNKIDWKAASSVEDPTINDYNDIQIRQLLDKLRAAQQSVRACINDLQTLSNTATTVISNYERSVTFTKLQIEHVRRIKEASIEFTRVLSTYTFEKELIIAKRRYGGSRLPALTMKGFLPHADWHPRFMPYAKKTFCEDPYQFLIETYCTQREQLPQRGDQIYEKYIKDNDANIPMDLKKRLDALKAHLANPPAPMRQEILNAWKAAHESSNSMFGSTLSPFVKTLDFKSPENDFLLHPDLQFGV